MEAIFGGNLAVFGQLFLAAFLGALVGAERQIAHKTAGMRTYALVSLGSALFSVISVNAFYSFPLSSNFDPSRIASQVVVGIGFLGAGLIILHRSKISGLTTAAGLWVSAAVGMAVGFKFYGVAVFAAFLTLFVFVVLWIVEQAIVRKWPSQSPEE